MKFPARFLAAVLCVLLLLLRSSTAAIAAEKRVALVIGNGAYLYIGRLDNPPNDARAMAGKLQRLGFQVEAAIDQGRLGMERAYENFVRNLRGADVALLFYSGH